MSRLYNPHQTDDRSFKQQMSDLGVEVIKPDNSVTGVKWAKKRAHKKPKPPRVTIGPRSMSFNVATVALLNNYTSKYDFGVGRYRGQKVLLISESADGYAITKYKTWGGGIAGGKALMGWLLDRGIKPGRYKLVEIKGGWMGVPE